MKETPCFIMMPLKNMCKEKNSQKIKNHILLDILDQWSLMFIELFFMEESFYILQIRNLNLVNSEFFMKCSQWHSQQKMLEEKPLMSKEDYQTLKSQKLTKDQELFQEVLMMLMKLKNYLKNTQFQLKINEKNYKIEKYYILFFIF